MTQKELCGMCTEYAIDSKCEYKKDCKLQGILIENSRLKKENRELSKKLKDLKVRISWERNPDMMGK